VESACQLEILSNFGQFLSDRKKFPFRKILQQYIEILLPHLLIAV